MSGSGFALGLAIASYEWMAAITLLIVGKYFLPIFIHKNLVLFKNATNVQYIISFPSTAGARRRVSLYYLNCGVCDEAYNYGLLE
jgi:hypothetical protein